MKYLLCEICARKVLVFCFESVTTVAFWDFHQEKEMDYNYHAGACPVDEKKESDPNG